MDQSPRDRQLGTCAKSVLSDGNRKAYLMTRCVARIVRFLVQLDRGLDQIIIRSSVDGRDFSQSEASRGHIGNVEITPRDQTGIGLHVDASQHDVDRDGIAIVIRIERLTYGHVELSGASDFHPIMISIGRLGKRVEEVHNRGAIERRSRCDRAVIMTPSWQNHLHDLQKAFNGGLRSRSTHDRGPIASRSWPDRGAIVVLLEAKLKPIQRGI